MSGCALDGLQISSSVRCLLIWMDFACSLLSLYCPEPDIGPLLHWHFTGNVHFTGNTHAQINGNMLRNLFWLTSRESGVHGGPVSAMPSGRCVYSSGEARYKHALPVSLHQSGFQIDMMECQHA